MDNLKINYDTMRIRMEFLYRTINMGGVIMNRSMKLSDNEQETVTSVLASAGLQVIYLHRIDGLLIENESEKRSAFAIAQVIADEFMRLSQKIHHACCGLPISITLARYEMMVQEGIDKILEIVKGLIEGKEAVNG
jgi:hypothetical protein